MSRHIQKLNLFRELRGRRRRQQQWCRFKYSKDETRTWDVSKGRTPCDLSSFTSGCSSLHKHSCCRRAGSNKDVL
ncbi:hypothetical protein ANANG_G00139520 [Anguilla anguilla]|uniref:Uncharacterized protein n=1 Tax=Anguilla anguilla TaxID=7936 RepID=A0A9D3MAH3_ANGAN|nr:hypothetical protein ANANG_G00139520 [Anguilla anguilla]